MITASYNRKPIKFKTNYKINKRFQLNSKKKLAKPPNLTNLTSLSISSTNQNNNQNNNQNKTLKHVFLCPYKVTTCNSNTPRFKELANTNNIKIVNNLEKADVIYSSRIKNLMTLIYKYPKKKFIVFTHEPFWDITRQKKINRMGKNITIINCYTGKMYLNNYYYFPFKHSHLKLVNHLDQEANTNYINKKKKVCILASYHGELINKTTEELCSMRNKLGMFGNKLGITDIYGQGWPKGYSQENSRSGRWRMRKKDILKNYYFNICFENSYIKYYVTEKLWDSIRCYNLPIYKGSPWIYEIFPKNSFLDYNDYSSPKELYNAITQMSYQEWCKRLNICIKVFNKILRTQNEKTIKDATYNHFIKIIRN